MTSTQEVKFEDLHIGQALYDKDYQRVVYIRGLEYFFDENYKTKEIKKCPVITLAKNPDLSIFFCRVTFTASSYGLIIPETQDTK